MYRMIEEGITSWYRIDVGIILDKYLHKHFDCTLHLFLLRDSHCEHWVFWYVHHNAPFSTEDLQVIPFI